MITPATHTPADNPETGTVPRMLQISAPQNQVGCGVGCATWRALNAFYLWRIQHGSVGLSQRTNTSGVAPRGAADFERTTGVGSYPTPPLLLVGAGTR